MISGTSRVKETGRITHIPGEGFVLIKQPRLLFPGEFLERAFARVRLSDRGQPSEHKEMAATKVAPVGLEQPENYRFDRISDTDTSEVRGPAVWAVGEKHLALDRSGNSGVRFCAGASGQRKAGQRQPRSWPGTG